jgi:hypothetical protein
MKIGDLVKIVGSHATLIGTIVSPWRVDDWWEVLTSAGRVIHWPESQMELIDESR